MIQDITTYGLARLVQDIRPGVEIRSCGNGAIRVLDDGHNFRVATCLLVEESGWASPEAKALRSALEAALASAPEKYAPYDEVVRETITTINGRKLTCDTRRGWFVSSERQAGDRLHWHVTLTAPDGPFYTRDFRQMEADDAVPPFIEALLDEIGRSEAIPDGVASSANVRVEDGPAGPVLVSSGKRWKVGAVPAMVAALQRVANGEVVSPELIETARVALAQAEA